MLALILVLLVSTYAFVLFSLRPETPGRQLDVGELRRRVGEGQVATLTLLVEDDRFVGADADGEFWVSTAGNDIFTSGLLTGFADVDGLDVVVDPQTSKNLLRYATQFLLPAATLIAGFALVYTVSSGRDRQLGFAGRNTGRRYRAGERPPVTFADVAGLDETVAELQEVKDLLVNMDRYDALGAKPPRGILLAGPPGCGKTLLAKALAGEANVPFFAIAASEFVEMFVGVGASRVRTLFDQARKAAPCIVFIDEIDAVGRSRAGNSFNAEGENTLNELLVQLDGFDPEHRIVLMAATNRADILDPALVRKGRFDRQVVIDAPDLGGRLAIAQIHARGKPLSADVDLDAFARRTVGFTGADIAAALNEAATLAARRRLDTIGMAEISEAVERVQSGPERRNRVLTPTDKQHVAYHEAGHALVGWVLSSATRVEKVSIVARGHNLGGTLNLAVDDHRVTTRSQYVELITSALAGRAAEEVVFADPGDGSRFDLSWATRLARQMVYELGMSDLGPIALSAPGSGSATREHSEEIAVTADRAVLAILEQADSDARSVLSAHRKTLDQLAQQLVARETLERRDLEELLGGLPQGVPDRPPTPLPRSASRR